MNNTAKLLMKCNVKTAESLSRETVAGFEAACGRSDLRTLRALETLSLILQKKSRLTEAEHLAERVLQGYEEQEG